MRLTTLFLFLFLLFQLHQPTPTKVILGPAQTVQTTYPSLGVHTRLTDEVEAWKIKRTLQLVREMGATTIVEFFPWAYYQPSPNRFNWDHADLVINHAHTQGLTIIARLGLIPDWARPDDTPLNYLDEAGYQPFAEYAAAFAERYAGKVSHIIVGNEPNLTFEWGGRVTTPADYVTLLSTIYPAVKSANPVISVLAGALAPTLEPEGSPNGLNDLLYLRGMYANGAGDWFDGLAVHSYGLTFPPDADPAPELLNFRRVELLRNIMVEFGDDDKAIYITESGYNDHPRWTRAVRPAQRITYTLDALRYAENNWPYVDLTAIWLFRTPAPSKNFMDYFSLVTPEFVEKPIYHEIKAFTGN